MFLGLTVLLWGIILIIFSCPFVCGYLCSRKSKRNLPDNMEKISEGQQTEGGDQRKNVFCLSGDDQSSIPSQTNPNDTTLSRYVWKLEKACINFFKSSLKSRTKQNTRVDQENVYYVLN